MVVPGRPRRARGAARRQQGVQLRGRLGARAQREPRRHGVPSAARRGTPCRRCAAALGGATTRRRRRAGRAAHVPAEGERVLGVLLLSVSRPRRVGGARRGGRARGDRVCRRAAVPKPAGRDPASAAAPRRGCKRPTGARTSSSRCCRTSCATRWRRSATPSKSSAAWAGTTPSCRGPPTSPTARCGSSRGWSTSCSTWRASARARSCCRASRWNCRGGGRNASRRSARC